MGIKRYTNMDKSVRKITDLSVSTRFAIFDVGFSSDFQRSLLLGGVASQR